MNSGFEISLASLFRVRIDIKIPTLKMRIKKLHIKRVTLILDTNELKKMQRDAEKTGPRNSKSWVNGKGSHLWGHVKEERSAWGSNEIEDSSIRKAKMTEREQCMGTRQYFKGIF